MGLEVTTEKDWSGKMPSKAELITQVEDQQKRMEDYKKTIDIKDSEARMHKSDMEQLHRTITSYENKAKQQKDQMEKLKIEVKNAVDELTVCKKELARLSDVSIAINEIKSSLSYPSQVLNDRIAELKYQLQSERDKSISIEELIANTNNLQLETRFLQGKVQAYELQMKVGRVSSPYQEGCD